MPLHIDYRPDNLDEIEGNEAVVKALKSKLKSKDIPHSFLITGPSGCGKTTIARIIKTELGCSDDNYKEVDSADFRGIDSIREIRKQMNTKGLGGGIKVYLLDECHQISKDGQSALLKALEDTPPHVYFILATTDPQKLLPTIKTRCTTYNVEPLTQAHMEKFLAEICDSEAKKVPEKVLAQIAMDSMGSPRAALVILDKVIDMKKKDMEEAAKQAAIQENQSIELYQAVIKKKGWKAISAIIKGLNEEPETIRIKGMFYFEAVLLNSGQERMFDILECLNKPIYNEPKRPQLSMMFFDASSC